MATGLHASHQPGYPRIVPGPCFFQGLLIMNVIQRLSFLVGLLLVLVMSNPFQGKEES